MTVKTKLTKKDYRSASMAIMWSRSFKVYPLILLVIILINVINGGNRIQAIIPTITPLIIISGLVYFLFSLSINKAYKSNPRVNESIEYRFDDAGVTATGETFKSEFDWNKLYKISKTRKWLLLWHSSQIANAIPMHQLPAELIQYLKKITAEHHVQSNL